MRKAWAVALGVLVLSGPGCSYLVARARDLGDCVRVQAGFGPGFGVHASAGGTLALGACVACVPEEWSVGWDYGRPSGLLDPAVREPGRRWRAEVDLSGLTAIAVIGALIEIAWLHEQHGGPDAHIFILPMIGRRGGGEGGEGSGEARDVWTCLFGHWEVEGTPFPSLRPSHASAIRLMFAPGFVGTIGPPGNTDLPLAGRSRLWSGRALREDRRAHVHAFDCEAAVYAGFVWARAGFSPGEFLDFLGGLVGWDLAGDDHR